MSKLKETIQEARDEKDAVVAAVKTVRALTTEAKRLLLAKEYDALEALCDSIQENAENIVAATLVGTDMEGHLDHEWLSNTSVN